MTLEDDTEDEGAEIIYCRYGQCADRVVPCESCVRIVIGGKHDPDFDSL